MSNSSNYFIPFKVTVDRMSFLSTIVFFAICLGLGSLSIVQNSYADDPKELNLIFQKQKDPAKVKVQAEEIATYLKGKLNIPINVQIPGDYATSVQALVSNKADIAYVDSMAFLLAERDGRVEILLAEQRVDLDGVSRTDYDSVFVVKNDSPLKDFSDLAKKAADLRMVFTSPTSTSGYIMPFRRLVKEGLLKPNEDTRQLFKTVSFAGSYTQALEQVLSGRGDVCAVSNYTVEGSAAESYLPKEKRDKLRILARTPGVPTHVVVARSDLSSDLKRAIKESLQNLSTDQPQLLADVYGTSSFTEVDVDAHVLASREAAQYLGIPLDKIVKPTS